MMKVRNTASLLCGLFLWMAACLFSCSKLDFGKKGRTNPLDIEFQRQVFHIQAVSGKGYAERNDKIKFEWEKTTQTEALNPELWLYKDNEALVKLGADFTQASGTFELDLASYGFSHLQNLQIGVKQYQNPTIWLDTMYAPILVYDEKQTPVISLLSAVNAGNKSIELQAEIIKLGNIAADEISICMNTTGSPTRSDRFVVCKGPYTDGSKLNAVFNSLTAATSYYFRPCVVKGATIAYGKEQVFKTALPLKPTVSLASVTGITSAGCNLNASVTDDGGADITQKGFVYNTTGAPDMNDNLVISGSSGNTISANLQVLAPSTKYYVAAFATNAGGTTVGSPVSFTTTSGTLVNKINCSSLTGITAKFEYWSGTVYSWTDWTISSSGYSGSCLYADNGNKPALGGYVQFFQNFTAPGFIRFWVNTPNPGYNNRIPTVYIDGIAQTEPTMIAGQASSFYWAQYQSQQIGSGNHTIRLDWSRTGMYYYYKLDEIEVYQ